MPMTVRIGRIDVGRSPSASVSSAHLL